MWGFFIFFYYICRMGQSRNKTGTDFEKSIPSSFHRCPVSPKMVWVGNGRNNMKKIIECNFDESIFKLDLDKSKLIKYDCIEKTTGDKFEIKKYNRSDLKHWTLYSEPYFKMSNKENLHLIDCDKYNDFIHRFFEYNTKNGFFEQIIQSMTSQTKGVYIKDDIIMMQELEFKTVVIHNQWKGYDRITIMFKLKNN